MSPASKHDIRQQVRQHYQHSIRQRSGCCSGGGCCGATPPSDHAKALGYREDDIALAPEVAGASLGCGNPQAIAALQPGETVVDLGSGAGWDCFLAARQVGETGQVIGVDMTPEMISASRQNAIKMGAHNVSFRLGEIEHLPIADGIADVIMSNCVINLSPDKEAVFREAYRVLKPGGRLAIADTVATAPLPDQARRDPELWANCISGAATIEELEGILTRVGFVQIRITPKDESREMIRAWAHGVPASECVVSAYLEALKPVHA